MGGSQNNGEPFAMQELADALQGTKKKLVKNLLTQIYLYG
jgi:hypothetical protein